MASVSATPRVFIACAPSDLKFAEIIIAKARGDRLPLAFDGMGEGRTDEVGWQLECRRRIRAVRVLVVLVSPHTTGSVRVRWQVRCARELGVPVLGITVGFDDEAQPGTEGVAAGESVVGWKWKTIAATMMRFAADPAPTGTAPAVATEPARQGSAA